MTGDAGEEGTSGDGKGKGERVVVGCGKWEEEGSVNVEKTGVMGECGEEESGADSDSGTAFGGKQHCCCPEKADSSADERATSACVEIGS